MPNKPNALSDAPVARHIREIVEKEGITLTEMAKRIGVSPTFLIAVCKGRKHLSEDLTYRIHRLFDCAGDTDLAPASMLARMKTQDIETLINYLRGTKSAANLLSLALAEFD